MNQRNGGQRVGCNGDCNQGRACDCLPVYYADDQDAWDWITDMARAALLTVAGVVALAVVAALVGYLVAL